MFLGMMHGSLDMSPASNIKLLKFGAVISDVRNDCASSGAGHANLPTALKTQLTIIAILFRGSFQ